MSVLEINLDSLGLGAAPLVPMLAFGKPRALSVGDIIPTPGQGALPTTQRLQQLRNTHHQLARLLAAGTPAVVASRVVGISQNRISILQNDPAFAELLAHYRGMEEAQWEDARADMKERLAQLGFDSIEVLHEKLLESPESFSTKELLAAIELSADRTGHGKVTNVNTEITHGISGELLAQIKRGQGQAASPSEEDRRTLLSLAQRATAGDPPAEEAPWIEGEGRCVREESSEGA